MRVVLLGDSHLARVRRDLSTIGPDVRNAAVGGACARDLRAQVDGTDLNEQDVVVVSIGTNDAAPWRRVDISDFARTWRDGVQSVPAQRLVYVTPPGVDEARLGGPNDRTNAVVDRYRAAALAVCDELGVSVVHAEHVVEPLGADAFVDDGVHLSGRAYQLLLPAIAAAAR